MSPPAWETRHMNIGTVSTFLVVVLLIASVVAASLEPHWSSRDGRRFIARAARLEPRDRPSWVEVRGRVDRDSILISARRRRHAHLNGTYHLAGTGEGSRRATVVVLRGDGDVLLRLPRNSRTLRAMTATSDPGANPPA